MNSMTQAASMTFEDIKFSYPKDKHVAIKNVFIDISQKELVVFVGPSGCGKSTLLRISAGLLFPQKGRLLIDGEDTIRLPTERRRIGWVPQSYALFEHLSIAENVAFGLKMAKIPKDVRDPQVKNMLRLCRIEELAERSVRALSGGQRQRVAIARALAINPRVLLLDEPLAALDPQLRLAIREDLELLLRESGVTTLFVTHDQSEALALADKVVILKDGQVEQIGTPEQVWNAPCNDFVAQFISNATVVEATALSENSARIAEGLVCHVSRPLDPHQQVRLALRKDDFELVSDGLEVTVSYCEYNGGVYHMKGTTADGVQIPVRSEVEVELGKRVHVGVRNQQSITVVG